MSFITDLAKTKVFGSGNRFTASIGTGIIKDIKIFASQKPGGDPFTEVIEILVKSSKPVVDGTAPPAVGTSASAVYKLSTGKNPGSARSSAQKTHFAILGAGAEALSEAELEGALTTLLRPLPEGNPLAGRTDPAKPCPARGYHIRWETYAGKDGNHYPNFFATETSDAELAENLKLLAGSGTEGGE